MRIGSFSEICIRNAYAIVRLHLNWYTFLQNKTSHPAGLMTSICHGRSFKNMYILSFVLNLIFFIENRKTIKQVAIKQHTTKQIYFLQFILHHFYYAKTVITEELIHKHETIMW